MTNPPLTTGRRSRVTTAIAGPLFAASLILAPGATSPAGAADEAVYRNIQICDPTACYIAWHVVDSDRDGVSDADELMAGTDPHDPASSPPLRHIAELAIQRDLPSFEAGLAVFVVLPADIHTTVGDRISTLVEAFPMGKRTPMLEQFGISAGKLAEMGIDPERNGLTIGLEHPTKDASLPPVEVGGIDIRLISDSLTDRHGPVTSRDQTENQVVETYKDGAYTVEKWDEEGWKSYEYFDETGTQVSEGHRVDPPHVDAPAHEGGAGHQGGAGHDHKPVPDEPNVSYIDADADAASDEVTPEQVDLVLRRLGSVVLTASVDNRPETDLSTLKRPATTILVDPDAATTYDVVLETPRVTTAQPELRDDLPSPLDAAPKVPGAAGCEGLC